MPNKYYAFDKRLEHRAVGQAALTATATLQTVLQRVAMRTDYVTRAIIESIDTASGNEIYTLVIEVSNDGFTTVEVAAMKTYGHTSVRQSGAPTNVAGQADEIRWSTEVLGVVYKDFRVRLIAAGTTPSIGIACYSTVEGK